MAKKFVRVINGGNFLKPKKWEDWTVGDFVEGEYLGHAEEKDLYGKPIHLVRATKSHFTGLNPIIKSGDKEGIVPLYNNGSLELQLADAEEGNEVQITYQGMAVTSKGKFKGKPCHNIEVLIAREEEESEESTDDLLG